ncbi:MAG: signal peptidase, partial [Reyranellales bacterium]
LWTVLARHLDDNAARLKKNGVTLTTADKVSPELRAVLANAAAGAIDKWKQAAGPEAAAVLDKR